MPSSRSPQNGKGPPSMIATSKKTVEFSELDSSGRQEGESSHGNSNNKRLRKLKHRLKNPRSALRNQQQHDKPVPRSSNGGEQTKVAVSDLEKLAQKSGKNTEDERFRVMPDYAYPNTKFNRDELRKEMNLPSSYYHDMRPENESTNVGSFHLEILQCFGIPRPELLKETSAFCLASCGQYAFKTDVMPPVANPMWLSKMRRACVFPLRHAYATVSIGVFAYYDYSTTKNGFIGRVVLDLTRMRPGCTYDVTLPLRQSSHVYTKQQRGALRFRCHLTWHNERKSLLSYLPKRVPRLVPNDQVTVKCCDNKSFQDVARVVHSSDLPGRFSMKLIKSTMREVLLVQIHIIRYMREEGNT